MNHPLHNIKITDNNYKSINAFIETLPIDTVKYELDKESGFLKLDRPNKYSSSVPCLYGFVPQTLCGKSLAKLATVNEGDGDPLDICVFTERHINHIGIIVKCKPIGGIRLIDRGKVDDKIISVLDGDECYSEWNDISDIPESYLKRLEHYFLTYKHLPGEMHNDCKIDCIYGRIGALNVIKLTNQDYLHET